MSPQWREKVALAVFAVLIVLSLFGLGWYLLAGHSWNVAASNIDDTFGSMDGYTAIVYDGTVVSEKVKDAKSDAAPAPVKKKPLVIDDVYQSYEDKGATVFGLDVVTPGWYAEGSILKKGTHRFGVFSVEKPLSKRAVAKWVTYFKAHQVDFIVAITSDREFLAGAEGIDIVVSTQDEDLFVMGETLGATFYVDTPEIGKVGAILISPSNVVSAKVIEEV